MKSKKFKNLVPFFALLVAFAFLSSCNRGVGCPNNFSMTDVLSTVAEELPEIATAIIQD